MTTRRTSTRLVRAAHAAVVVASLAAVAPVALTAGRQPVAWRDLTVPADRLPQGCRLAPSGDASAGASSQSGVTRLGAPTFVGSRVLTGMGQNPWIGADPTVLASLRREVEGSAVRSPADAWWPDRRQSAAASERAAEGILEGYAALYAHNVSVYAVRFEPGVERQPPFPRDAVDAATIRIDLDRIAVSVHTDGGPCGTAVVDHLRGLRPAAR